MKYGVRFCGGCNPRYDRGKALEKIKESRKEDEFVIAEEGKTYDQILVIGGCTNCCASHCQFSSKEGVIKMWDEEHIDKVLKQMEKTAEKTENRKIPRSDCVK